MPVKTIDLNGNWKVLDSAPGAGRPAEMLRKAAEGAGEWLDVPVPGDIHPSLQQAGRIPDPFHGLNVRECEWTGRRDWWHYREFEVPKSLARRKVELVFDGIDTFADIYLNGERIGQADNMFRPYRFEAGEALRPGERNTLLVRVRAVLDEMEKQDTSKYMACFYTPRVLARKAQCQFSWDWAPHLPAVGIWRGVRLEASAPGNIEDVHIRAATDGSIFLKTWLDAFDTEDKSTKDWSLEYSISGHGQRLRKEHKVISQTMFSNLKLANPRLWWPNGYGKPNLYKLTVRLKSGKKLLASRSLRFGFREVRLIEEPKSDGRRGFQFRVNGRDIFCQGANWIPADCFTGTVDRPRYEHLIRLTREANFNMLRVWGGGIYEKDAFYDLCDENGILVWQDLMFACADIPDDNPEFAMGVIDEFDYQVRRLRNHPCLAHWCGGNEKTGTFGKMIAYGDRITKYIGRGVVAEHCPDLAYTPSSPYSHTAVGNDPQSGDTHGGIYEKAFIDDCRKLRDYIVAKDSVFNSEFGYHGPPQMRSLRKFMPDDKLWPLNEVWEEHVQDNPYNELKETFVQVQEKYAAALIHKPASAPDFVKAAGTLYAELIHEEFEHHRRMYPVNAGAMIWMLNDCWPCASWSIIDYYGLPKQVYYALKRACDPVVASFKKIRGGWELFLTSALTEPVKGVLELRLENVDGTSEVLNRRRISLPAQESRRYDQVSGSALPRRAGTYLVAEYRYGKECTRRVFFPYYWNGIDWPDPELALRHGPLRETRREYRCTVTLKARRYARCVNLQTAEDQYVYYSDNFFDMLPGETRRVRIASPQPFDPKALRVRHWLEEWD